MIEFLEREAMLSAADKKDGRRGRVIDPKKDGRTKQGRGKKEPKEKKDKEKPDEKR